MTARSADPPRWEEMLPSTPWERRRAALRALFEAIAPSYDRLNHWLSLGFDERWRARAVREACGRGEPAIVVDLASGTGDHAAALLRWSGRARVLRLDLSAELLRRGSRKIAPSASAPALVAEMERLPVRRGSCDAIVMAYALRHVESLDGLLRACADALRPGGGIAFVDMALPERGFWAGAYRFYFRACLPRLAVLFGGPREAYELMVRSVEAFPGWDRLEDAARSAGFTDLRTIRLTGGAARVFVARR